LSEEEEDDVHVMVQYIAETNLPTDLGHFRLRAYRTLQSPNLYVGTEPCVISSVDKPPFDANGKLLEGVPVRVHDQCFTSEVFRSQR
jgi:GTP cyclohydrolase II